MKVTLIVTLALVILIGTATASATTLRDVFLNRGDRAFSTGGSTSCIVRPHNGSLNGFVCRVGGDYRAKYGVIINEGEVAITQYTSFDRYRVILRKRQSPLER
ncbi:MAG: hypothetical protein M3540_10980 [Actinomycetota bacterium]|nr:hypothetical protein [Actinomycetota bacterium]